MSDLKLFRISKGIAAELAGGSIALEKSLQKVMEDNMETLFGVRFLATQFRTGRRWPVELEAGLTPMNRRRVAEITTDSRQCKRSAFRHSRLGDT